MHKFVVKKNRLSEKYEHCKYDSSFSSQTLHSWWSWHHTFNDQIKSTLLSLMYAAYLTEDRNGSESGMESAFQHRVIIHGWFHTSQLTIICVQWHFSVCGEAMLRKEFTNWMRGSLGVHTSVFCSSNDTIAMIKNQQYSKNRSSAGGEKGESVSQQELWLWDQLLWADHQDNHSVTSNQP